MKLLPGLLLGFILVSWGVYEVLMPPIVIEYWSPDWGGHLHTRHIRGEVEATFRDAAWKVNGTLIVLECSLVVVAVGLGLLNARRDSNDDFNKASRAFAASSAVLHAGVVLLPLFNAGSDTVWLGRQPGLLAIGMLVLWPNVTAVVIAVRLMRPRPKTGTGKLPKNLVVMFLALIACVWSAALVVGVVGHFDVKMPLSGFILGTVALWLTALARALRRVDDLKLSNAALSGLRDS